MKYFISSLGFWSKNETSILNKKKYIVVKKRKEKDMAYVEIFYGGSETFLQTENKTFL